MRSLVLTVMLLSVLVSMVGAQEIQVVTEEWPPYNYTEDGEIMGVMTEVVKATLEKTDLQWNITVLPWARAYKMASEEENTMIYTIFKMPEREDLFKWIKVEGIAVEMYLFSPKGRDDIQIDTLEDAKQYKVGVTRETSTHVFLRSKGFEEGVNLFPVAVEVQNALKADPARQRIDLTTGDRLSLALWLKKAGLPPDFWQEEVFLFKEDFYLAFNKKTSDEVVDKVRNALEEVRAEGTLETILNKYLEMYKER